MVDAPMGLERGAVTRDRPCGPRDVPPAGPPGAPVAGAGGLTSQLLAGDAQFEN
jgi:hypothetical protein